MKKKTLSNKILMFDFDGVLVDSTKIVHQCNEQIQGFKISKKTFQKMFMGNIYEFLKLTPKFCMADQKKILETL